MRWGVFVCVCERCQVVCVCSVCALWRFSLIRLFWCSLECDFCLSLISRKCFDLFCVCVWGVFVVLCACSFGGSL